MAKDIADRGHTRDFITGASAAERQRAFVQRKRQAGYRRRTVWLHDDSWRTGYAAGQAGGEPRPPDGVEDWVAWMSGYREGAGR